MTTRTRLALLAFVLSLATVAGAQVSAPRMVGDEPAAEEPSDEGGSPADSPPAAPAGGHRARHDAGRGGSGTLPPIQGAGPNAEPGSQAPGSPRGKGAAGAEGEPAPERWLVYDQPPPPPPPEPSSDLARRLIPVSATWEKLIEDWTSRRTALREQDPGRARVAETALLAAQRELAIENLVPMAAALVRESGRELDANHPADAVEHAELATELAPDFPDAHLALARARLARSPGELLPILSAVGATVAAAGREPHTVRAFLTDLGVAALAAVFAAAAATATVIFFRKVRLFLHDFHHLPVLRGTAPIQSTFLAMVLFASPLAFGLGPAAVIAAAIAVIWLYLSIPERIMATATLAVVIAAPWLAGAGVRMAAWTGTLAETVYDMEHGGLSDAEAATLAARWEGGAPPPALAAALGRHFKRRGDLERAKRWYGVALASGDRAAEVQVNLGNVLFLEGDFDAAKAAYLAAADRAAGDLTTLGAAHYDLSKLYLRTSELDKSQAARERAQQEDGPFLAQHGSDEDFSANRFLVDVPVPLRKIGALAAADETALEIEGYVRGRFLGALSPSLWPWSGVLFLALLWAVAFAREALAPSHPCQRCGRPACRRCDGGTGPLCGQCVNAFVKKGVVDARDRLRKEAEVRRHEQFNGVTARILAVVGGGAGLVWTGAAIAGFLYLLGILFLGAVVWFWRGVLPPPQPSPWVLIGKIGVALPLGVLLYALSVRAVFRKSRS